MLMISKTKTPIFEVLVSMLALCIFTSAGWANPIDYTVKESKDKFGTLDQSHV